MKKKFTENEVQSLITNALAEQQKTFDAQKQHDEIIGMLDELFERVEALEEKVDKKKAGFANKD